MILIVTLPFILGYLFLLFWVPAKLRALGIKRGYSKTRVRLLWWAGFLLVFLPLFWDWIPTVATHRYYCAKDAGFFLYKTPEQWVKENPEEAKGLRYDRLAQDEKLSDGIRYILNQRIAWQVKKMKLAMGIRKTDDEIIDRKTGEVLAQHRDYSTAVDGGNMVGGTGGGLRDWKLWMQYHSCESGEPHQWERSRSFFRVEQQYKKLGGGE